VAVGQVLGIGAIFWFKDLASKQIRAAQKELLSLQKTATFSTKTMLAPMGLVQMGKGLKTMANWCWDAFPYSGCYTYCKF